MSIPNDFSKSFDSSYNDYSNDDNDDEYQELSDNTSIEESDYENENNINTITITSGYKNETGVPREIQAALITEDDWDAMKYMLSFSFSSGINSNPTIMEALRKTFVEFSEYVANNQDNLDEIRIKAILNIASKAYGYNIDKINRAKEERLCFEAVCLLLFSRRNVSHDFLYVEDEFLTSYPEYSPTLIGREEFQALFKFCNLMKMAMHLIPPLHNKNHLLDLVTRLVEGKDVRHVTGTGATKATKARVNIILKEGNLVVSKRPPRMNTSHSSSGSHKHKRSSGYSQHKKSISRKNQLHGDSRRKRGRPRKDSISSDEISLNTAPASVSSYYHPTTIITTSASSSMADPFNLQQVSKRPRPQAIAQISPLNSIDSSNGSNSVNSHHNSITALDLDHQPARYFLESYLNHTPCTSYSSNSLSQSQPWYFKNPSSEMKENYSMDNLSIQHQGNSIHGNSNDFDSTFDDLPLGSVDLIRSQSIEWWNQSITHEGGAVDSFKPELLRETSFFHGINADGRIQPAITITNTNTTSSNNSNSTSTE